jgi:cephalosporin-C deacetylase
MLLTKAMLRPRDLLIFVTAILQFGVAAGSSAPESVHLSLADDAADGLVSIGQGVTLTATIHNQSEDPIQGTLEWELHTVAFDPPAPPGKEVEIAPGDRKTFSCRFKFPGPGFAETECRVKTSSGEEYRVRRRTGCHPEKLSMAGTQEPDFDQFWEDSLVELRTVAADIQVRPVPDLDNEGIETFEVTLKSFGNVTVRGWLEVPRSGGPFPVVIRVPGYGGKMKPVSKGDDMMVFSFNPRAHGNSQDEAPGKPVDYWIRGLDDKDTYFYRGAYLDCIRAVDFIATRADADQDRIAIWGGSQGGGLAMATAALDSRIDLCVSDIPFLCDWPNYFKLTHWPEMNQWIESRPDRTWGSTLRTLSYFDAMNLAPRIQCPVFMGVGLQDRICPPTTNFAAFNRIRGRRSFHIYPDLGHGLGKEHYARVWDWMRAEFGLPKLHPSR